MWQLHASLIYAMIPSNMVLLTLLSLFLLFVLFFSGEKAPAYGVRQNEFDFLLSWGELTTKHFVSIYSSENIGLAQPVDNLFTEDLNKEYQLCSSAFGVSLQMPISIRHYPKMAYFFCLNALSPELGEKATHSHNCFREFSVIVNNIRADFNAWQVKALNDFRQELVALFGEKVSSGNAIDGLLMGLGGYTETPVAVFDERNYKCCACPLR
jgi:hypothetical protein